MVKLICVLFLLSFHYAHPQELPCKEKFPKTERCKVRYREDANGLPHGKYIQYNSNGQVILTGEYVHGKAEGNWKEYTNLLGYQYSWYSNGKPIYRFADEPITSLAHAQRLVEKKKVEEAAEKKRAVEEEARKDNQKKMQSDAKRDYVPDISKTWYSFTNEDKSHFNQLKLETENGAMSGQQLYESLVLSAKEDELGYSLADKIGYLVVKNPDYFKQILNATYHITGKSPFWYTSRDVSNHNGFIKSVLQLDVAELYAECIFFGIGVPGVANEFYAGMNAVELKDYYFKRDVLAHFKKLSIAYDGEEKTISEYVYKMLPYEQEKWINKIKLNE